MRQREKRPGPLAQDRQRLTSDLAPNSPAEPHPPYLRDLLFEAPVMLGNLLRAGLEKRPDIRPTVRAFGEQLIIATISDGDPLSEEEQSTLRLRPLDDE